MKNKSLRSYAAGALSAVLLLALATSAMATYQKQATLDYSGIQITLNGNKIDPVDANGNPVEPFAISGTTYLPVRAIANALNLEVAWEQETSTVILTLPEEQRPIYITRSGRKYHYDSSCNGGTYWEAPLASAIGMGLEPCDKCILKGN